MGLCLETVVLIQLNTVQILTVTIPKQTAMGQSLWTCLNSIHRLYSRETYLLCYVL